jgi:2'-5' RNA ligase
MRTFIAVTPPAEVAAHLDALVHALARHGADVRWSTGASIHVTLKFLGEIEPAILPNLVSALRQRVRRKAPFDVELHGLGSFPSLRSPKVVWCGLGAQPRLSELQAEVEETCADFGYEPEQRAFRPHLTLGRVRGTRNLRPLVEQLASAPPSVQGGFTVDHVDVYRSTLRRTGAVYDVLEAIVLEGKP